MNPKFSLKDRLKSFTYAFNGLKSLVQGEHNFRIHLFTLVLVVVLGFVFHLSKLEWIAIVSVSGLVLITEALNTCIEKLCDFIHPEKDERIGQIKDIAAAAVLISAILAVVVGGIVFGPKVLDALFT